MKIAIVGGHLTPALAVIEELLKDSEILYIGRKHALEGDSAVSLEYEEITKKGIPFAVLRTGRLQRSITRHTFSSLSKIPVGFVQAFIILKKFNPEVVVGFGGYVSLPVMIAAKILRIPIIIHEQTLEAGVANRLISKFATKVCISFESSDKFFPEKKTILTGNPIRKSILRPAKKFNIEGREKIIYITGGSLGSHFINILVSKSLPKLLDKYILIHQIGGAREFSDFEKLSILKEGLNNNKRNKYIISNFFSPEDIGPILKTSTLVVGRAGINTVTELIILKKPSLLIPLPVSQKNEQMKNAAFFKKLGLGEIGDQKNLTSDIFLNQINHMIKNIENYKVKGDFPFPTNAAKKIAEQIYAAKKNNN